MICDGWWEKRDYFFGGLFSAFDLDSLIPIFLSNCSLALFTVLGVLSAHKILVVAVNLKLKLSMLILYEALWLNICKNIPFQGTYVETKVVGDIYMLADDDCKNHHVATLQLPHIADLSPQCLVPTCPAYIQAQEFRIFKADFKASIT